jgi:hypothetical protein
MGIEHIQPLMQKKYVEYEPDETAIILILK